MTRRVSVRPAAERDIDEARRWYDDQRAGLGETFLAAVADAFTLLEEHADRFPLYYRGFRRVMTQRFPYKLFYRIENETVIVFRILHAARDHTWRLEE